MKTLIIEKNKMGPEEEPELLVKGESDAQKQTRHVTAPLFRSALDALNASTCSDRAVTSLVICC